MVEYLDVRAKDNPCREDNQSERGRRELAAFIQSMFTFGLLEAVTGQHVPESALITSEAGRPVLSKVNVPALVRNWIARVQSQEEEEELQTWLERAETNIEQAHSMWMPLCFDNYSVLDVLGDDVPGMVCLIATIGDALDSAKMCFPPSMPQKRFVWNGWVQPYQHLFTAQLLADGWCPSIIAYFNRSLSVSAIEYISACGGPIQDGKRHDACSAHACATYVIDDKTYRPKHAESCASPPDTPCEYAAPPLEDVQQLLLEGVVPVVTWEEGRCGEPARIQVHNAYEIPYVAFSHVWADGLGSNTETGLPTCQVRRLASLVSAIRPGAAFWIDSLCIPQAEDVRKRAIGLMWRTYKHAADVVVLDSGLQPCSSTAPRSLLMLRVLTSGWMRRLWTLQEAVLSRSLHLVFADTTLELMYLMPSLAELLHVPHLIDLLPGLLQLRRRAMGGATRYSINDVADSLQWRTTSRPADETLAIASLLGVDPARLIDWPSQERMVRLLRALRKLPREILFMPGAKLDVDGFRWAPASFMMAHGGGVGRPELGAARRDADDAGSGSDVLHDSVGREDDVCAGNALDVQGLRDRLRRKRLVTAPAGRRQLHVQHAADAREATRPWPEGVRGGPDEPPAGAALQVVDSGLHVPEEADYSSHYCEGACGRSSQRWRVDADVCVREVM